MKFPRLVVVQERLRRKQNVLFAVGVQKIGRKQVVQNHLGVPEWWTFETVSAWIPTHRIALGLKVDSPILEWVALERRSN